MIQSVERALDIIIVVSDNHGKPVTLKEIAQKTKLNQSTCCHLVETLVNKGFLSQVSRSSGYILGIYSYNIARYKDFHRDVVFTCQPILRWIRQKTNLTTVLTNLIEGEKFVLNYADVPDNTLSDRGDLYKGSLYASATGRAMLSKMNLDELKNVVKKVGLPKDDEWQNIATFEQLSKELTSLANNRIVKISSLKDERYICTIATAFTSNNDDKFAIGVEIKQNAPIENDKIEEIEKILITAAKEVNRRMKFETIY